MHRRLHIPAAILLILAIAAAGCGGTKTVTKTVTTTAKTASTQATTATTPPTGTTATTDASTPPSDAGAGDSGGDSEPASIVLYTSIADAKVGGKASAVVSKIGPPDTKETVDSELGGPRTVYTYGNGAFTFQAIDGNIVQVETQNPGDRTDKGIGPGSKQSAVLAAYPAASCDGAAGTTLCRLQKGSTVTDFFITNSTGKVKRVVIGLVD